MPKKKCFTCGYTSCVCPPIKPLKYPAAQVDAICPPEQIPPALPLFKPWEIEFTFPENVDITPETFEANGVFNVKDCCLQSVATAFFAPDRTPTRSELDYSTILLPISGCEGSITGEVFIFGDAGFDYTASLAPFLLEDGRTVTLLTNFVETSLAADTPSQLLLVARLFFCLCPERKKRRRCVPKCP